MSRVASAALLVSCLFVAPETWAQSEDLQGLKSTHALLLEAVERGNPQLLESVVHPQGIGFFAASQFPVKLTATNRVPDATAALLADLADFTRVPLENEYRVVGTTGIVCTRVTQHPQKGSKAKPAYLRSTYVFTKVDDRWLLASWHTSNIPLVTTGR